MKLVMTLLVRDEEDIVASNIDFHLNNGVDFIIAMDNLSSDGAADILRLYERKGMLHYLSQHDDNYAQGIWVTQMARLASVQFAADWIINNDVDEFWWPEQGNLRSILASVDPLWPAVAVERTNFVPRPIPAGEFFADYLTIRERHSLNVLGAPIPGKVCHRALSDIAVQQGNHGVTRNGRALPTTPTPITILHFPMRTYRQFANKIAKGGAACARNPHLPPEVGGTWRKLYEIWQRGELEAYYQGLIRDDENVAAGKGGVHVTDISHRFSLSQIDHHELLEILTLRYGTCWRVSEHKISFPASLDYRLQLKMRHGQIKRITAGASLSEQELDELLAQVDADLKDDRIADYGAEILFARRPVTGAFRFRSIPMQILPPPPEAPRPPAMTADHPFVLEYPIRCSQTPQVRYLRRRKNAVEWAWVLNALLYGSIKYSSSRARQMWAVESGQSNCSPFWAQEFYIVPGFRAFTSALSAEGDPLPVVPADSYFGDGRARANLPIDTFFLPDNFNSLVGAFLKLDSDSRRRFLRSAAAIYMAVELWEVSISSYFLACVQAIETLVDRPPPTLCPLCSKDEQPGPTQLFRKFVEKYCQSSYVDQAPMRKNLYRARSDLVHGRYLFQFDEAPFAVNLGATIASDPELEMSRAALTLAKEGARNWLLSQSN